MEGIFILFVIFIYVIFLQDKTNLEETTECPACDGDGIQNISCCGYNIKGSDSDLCPNCLEHCGDGEPCEECDGKGIVPLSAVNDICPPDAPTFYDEDRNKYND